MTSQLLNQQTIGVQVFAELLRAYAATTRRLNAQLVSDHGLTINDYEVLLRLARAPGRRMRRVDLAAQVLLTPSGITRLLEGLERCGYVGRAACDTDRRVVYAVLTDAGLAKLLEARSSHFAQIDDHFAQRLHEGELESIRALLAKLADESVDAEPAAVG